MKKVFKDIVQNVNFVGDVGLDTYNLLKSFDCSITAEHSMMVAKECKALAKKFGLDYQSAEIAGYLHDISGVIPNDKKLEVAKFLNIEVLKEEEELPMILHQKLSKAMAQDIWGIKDENILNAIGCHTTLRKEASQMDMVLFVSDKLQWDQEGSPPYMSDIKKGLNISLEHGAYAFIKYQMNNRANLRVIHPWLLAAYNDLKSKL